MDAIIPLFFPLFFDKDNNPRNSSFLLEQQIMEHASSKGDSLNEAIREIAEELYVKSIPDRDIIKEMDKISDPKLRFKAKQVYFESKSKIQLIKELPSGQFMAKMNNCLGVLLSEGFWRILPIYDRLEVLEFDPATAPDFISADLFIAQLPAKRERYNCILNHLGDTLMISRDGVFEGIRERAIKSKKTSENGLWGLKNLEDWLVEPIYDQNLVRPGYNYKRFSKLGNYGGVKTESDGWLIPPIYGRIRVYGDAYYLVEKFKEPNRLLDRWGACFKELDFDKICYFDMKHSLVCVQKDNKFGWLDKQGNIVIEVKFSSDNEPSFKDGLAKVKLGDKYGFVDTKGKVIIEFKYEKAKDFSEGYASVKLAGKWGFVDAEGKRVVDFKYEDSGKFSEGYASVKLAGKWGFVDKNGKLIIPCNYLSVDDFSGGRASVCKAETFFTKGETFYIDKQGNKV